MKQTPSKSDELFSKIFHASPFAMNLFRLADGHCVDVNGAFLSLTGYSREEFANHTAAELDLLVDPNARNVWIKEIKEFGSALPHDFQIRQKSGAIRDVIGSFELVDVDGEQLGLVMVTDITERKRANLKLEEQNKQLAFQNEEKEKRAAELAIANKELLFQNEEKEKRAAELVIANKELLFQNEEKEKRAAELVVANKEIIRRLQNIQALQRIDQAIAGSLDLKLTLNVVLEQTKTELKVDAAAVLLLNPHTQILEFAAGIGFRSKAFERSRLRLGEGHGGRAALERRTVNVTNLLDAERSDQFVRAPLLADEGFVTYFSTPLIAKGQVKGVLEVFHRTPFISNQDWLDFLEVLAGQTAIAVDSASLFTDLQHSNTELFNAYDSTIEGWSHALDLRDKETEGHTLRVTEMTMNLARAAGITEEELVHVRRGALLHDIGKMGVPDHILLKPDKLTDEEWVAMRKHPIFAFELLSPIAYLRPALDIPYCHHEKWDGSGYPRGLKGEQIPMVARLFAIVDVWDALLSDRPYRQGWSKEKVIEHIKSLSRTHFEPKAVELFLKVINEDDKDSF
jgi:PAS domain S-box-containing protein/putative nucleotidyltransferase with HDIG domain